MKAKIKEKLIVLYGQRSHLSLEEGNFVSDKMVFVDVHGIATLSERSLAFIETIWSNWIKRVNPIVKHIKKEVQHHE